MTFKFNGLSFDTSKPIYVLGYEIKNSWFCFNVNERGLFATERILYYGAKCKRKYIKKLVFNGEPNKNNEPVSIAFDCFHRPHGENEIIIGHSPQECLRIFGEKYGGENK